MYVSSVAFSPDGKMLATGNWRGIESSTGMVNILDVNTGKLLRTFKGHINRVDNVAFVSDGKVLASMSDDDGILYLWDVAATDDPQ